MNTPTPAIPTPDPLPTPPVPTPMAVVARPLPYRNEVRPGVTFTRAAR